MTTRTNTHLNTHAKNSHGKIHVLRTMQHLKHKVGRKAKKPLKTALSAMKSIKDKTLTAAKRKISTATYIKKHRLEVLGASVLGLSIISGMATWFFFHK